MRDNLFDNKITSLDLVKVALLVVTLFSTWRIMDLITPEEPFAFVRIAAAVAVVEGAFVAFERSTRNAKTERQTVLATVGFFCSLTVITIYLALSGFLEFGGPALLGTQVGLWAGISWSVQEVVMVFALAVTAAWVAGLASIARFFALADPDKQAELQRNQMNGDVKMESNNAFKKALSVALPEIAIQRALLSIDADYGQELTPSQLAEMKGQVESRLREHYQKDAVPVPSILAAPIAGVMAPSVPAASAPVTRPTRPVVSAPVMRPTRPVAATGGNGSNGHHPTV